ncbi:MAG: EAL domain-containing protein [Alphaproteobacteria bacterium]
MSSLNVPVGRICQTSLLTCAPETSVAEVAALLHAARCSSVVVQQDRRAVGIWTERDALAALCYPERLSDPISRWMSTPVKTIDAEATIGDAGIRMKQEDIRHLLVTFGEDEELRGMISQSDVVLNHGIECFMQMREVQSVLRRRREWVDASQSVAAVAALMHRQGVDAVAVTFEDNAHGIITERDVVRLLSQGQTEGTIGSFATRPLITVPSTETLYSARRVLADNNLRHLGIVDDRGELVTLLSFADILGGIESEYVADLRQTLEQREEALALSRGKLRLAGRLFERILEGIVITDSDGIINSVNPAFCNLIGYDETELIAKSFTVLGSGRHGQDFFEQIWETARRDGTWQGEIWGRRKDGELFLKMVTVTGIAEDANGWSNFAAMFADIVSSEQNAARLHYLANYDPLTTLPNRAQFIEHLAQATERARKHGYGLALLYVDIDRFKLVNESLGYGAGDDLLTIVARRIADVVGEGGWVGRLAGDQFGILLHRVASVQQTSRTAEAILDRIAATVDLQDQELFVTATIGIALYPSDTDDCRVLLNSAESALRKAKQQGRNCFRFVTTNTDSRCRNRLGLESRLRRAIDREEFEVYYQPKISLSSMRVIGMEALLRWIHPEIGVVSPDEFIPIAEDNGLISLIGEWVLDVTCRQTQRWSREIGPLRVAVNVSGRQLNPTLLDVVDGILDRTGIPPEFLELEITETVAMDDVAVTMEILSGLSGRGISLSIDDFGTGYSSFAYLRKFPINLLKIDRSFVKDIDRNERASVIPKAIISMAHSLGLDVVAEGIETPAQLALLKSYGCDEGQGYYFGRPMNAEAFADYVLKMAAIPRHLQRGVA